MKKIVFLATLALGLGAVDMAQAACRVAQRSWFVWGGDGSFDMTADSGKPCGVSISVLGSVEYLKVVTPPKNGRAGVFSMSSFGYVSKPGFKGQDSFVVQGKGSDFRNSGVTNLTVNITVE